MGNQLTLRKRSGRRGRSRIQTQRLAARKQRRLGFRLLLVIALLTIGAWGLTQVPPGLLVLLAIMILLVVVALIGVWLAIRPRSYEELAWPDTPGEQERQHVDLIRLANVAQMDLRSVQVRDLEHFGHDEFEYFVGALLEAAGVAFDLKRIGGAGDQGADLIGKDRFSRTFIVQCKRYFGHPVRSSEMRDFLGARSTVYQADEAWFVTTSSFTRDAKAAAARLSHLGLVVLIDGEKLVELIRVCWGKLPSRWQQRLIQIIRAGE